MAITVATVIPATKVGFKKRMSVTNITFDDSYPTGGEAVTPGNLGLTKIEAVIINGNTGHNLQWDQANKKIKAYYADYDAVADGALIQVPDTTDLATVVATVVAFGT